MINKLKMHLYWVIFALIIIITSFQIFSIQISSPILDYDEARHGVNAFEMILNNDYITHTYDGIIDYWNLKPPLSMWQIILSYKIFGYNVLGLRFFSAIYLIVIIAVSMLFLKKNVGIVASISVGLFFSIYGPRFPMLFGNGDPNALHVFLCLLSCLFLYYAYKKDSKYLIGVGFFLALDFLTKATHVISIEVVVIFTFFLLYKKKRFSIRELLIYWVAPMLLPVLVWGIFRYSNDGITFFVKMIGIDVLNRVGGVVENHAGGLFFYFRIGYYFGLVGIFCMFITIVLAIILLMRKIVRFDEIDITFVVIFSLIFIIPFALFSVVPTKLTHYIFPCIIGIAFIFSYACQFVITFIWTKSYKNRTIPSLIAITVVIAFVDPFITNNVFYKPIVHTESIFKQVPELNEKNYYVMSIDGKKQSIPQSWLLEGNFMGYSRKHGGYSEFLNSEQKSLILLKYATSGELTNFLNMNPRFFVLIEYEDYALLSLSTP